MERLPWGWSQSENAYLQVPGTLSDFPTCRDDPDSAASNIMTRKSNTSGGAAGAGGFSFQAAVSAIAYVHTLRGTRVQWLAGLAAEIPVGVSSETGGPGDDISLELADGSIVEVQAKKGLSADGKFWSVINSLSEGINSDRCADGILIVCPSCQLENLAHILSTVSLSTFGKWAASISAEMSRSLMPDERIPLTAAISCGRQRRTSCFAV